MEEKKLKKEIIELGEKLHSLRLTVARGGNLSARLDQNTILITATSTSLGDLREDDIVRADLTNPADCSNKRLSSEFPLHSLIYKKFQRNQPRGPCHPPLANGYFAVMMIWKF
jgi:L-fuculose-phosphate aldolase